MTDEELVNALRNFAEGGYADLAADRIEALTEQLKTVLDREAASCFRHDAKTDELEAKLAAAVDWFETIRDRAKGDYMAHTYYLDALAALATIKRREP